MMFWIVQTWCVIAILMLLLSLLKRSFKVSPALLHGLWVVVLLKSLAPPIVAWPYSIPAWSNTQNTVVSSSDPSPIVTSATSPTTTPKPIEDFQITPSSVELGGLPPTATPPIVELSSAATPPLRRSKSTASIAFLSIDFHLVQRVVLGIWILGKTLWSKSESKM